MTNKEKQFKNLLKNIFQFNKDRIELDFGVYRIFKKKEEDIKRFIDEKLSQKVEEALTKALDKHGIEGINEEALRENVFDHILNFFKRFYEKGDFYPRPVFSQREEKKAPYCLDYYGEEILFWWPTKGHHYIKTDKLLENYPIELGGKSIILKVSEVDTIKGNEKDKRKFYLKGTCEREEKLIVELAYVKEAKEDYKEFNTDNLYELLRNHVKSLSKEDVDFHVRKFKNLKSSDFFIHPKLRSFLSRELQYYLKNEIVDLNNPISLIEARITQEVAQIIIDFLANMEELQQLLWEKKKFAYNVSYVLTLDRFKNLELVKEIEEHQNFPEQVKEWTDELQLLEEVPLLYETLKKWKEVSEVEVNKEWLTNKQRERWEELFGKEQKAKVSEILSKDPSYLLKIANRISRALKEAPLFGENNTINLKQIVETYLKIKHLPIDTKYFPELKYKILEQFEDIENELDGLLIKSDNWQALNTILPKYREKVQTIYIDPPFNTGEDFLYKDNYQDATWLTLMESRLLLSMGLLKKEGTFFLHLDHNADYYGRFLGSLYFPFFKGEIIWQSSNSPKPQSKDVGMLHQKILVYMKSDLKVGQFYRFPVEKDFEGWMEDERGRFTTITLVARGIQASKNRKKFKFREKEDMWLYSKEQLEKWWNEGKIYITKSGNYRLKIYEDEIYKKGGILIGSIWTDISPIQGNSDECKNLPFGMFKTQKPESLLKRIIKATSKENEFILDFFLGSGTTTAVAHKLKRKWLGVELGEHFESIALPRMKKVLYYDRSGISKDEDVKEYYNEYKAGGFFRYLYLEQYEDSLENVDFENDYLQERTQELEKIKELYPEFAQKELFGLLRQFVIDNTKTLLTDVVNLKNPFKYEIKLADGKKVFVDFVETFNLIKPVNVKRIFERESEGKRYIFVDGGSIGVVWRETSDEYDQKFAKKEEEFIKQNLPDYEKKREIFVNGILGYPKSFLDFKAKETLTEFRKLLLQGVRIHEED